MGARHRRGVVTVGLALTLGLLVSGGTAPAATVTRPGFTATVGTRVAPTRLPRTGGAPVTLTLAGATSRSFAPPETASPTLEAVRLQLDPHLTVDTTGLPVCTKPAVNRSDLQHARRACGAALVGSGTWTETIQFPEQAPFQGAATRLFFNARSGGRPAILMYTYFTAPARGMGAFPIGPDRTPVPLIGESPYATHLSFHIRFGRTWRYKGQTHSFLSGRCATGKLENRVTLQFNDGTTADASSPQRCTKGV